MKAVTEFSGTIIRNAAKALADAKSALPQPPVAAAAPAPAAEAAPAEATPAEATPAETPVVAPVESDSDKAALEAAVGKETGIAGDRLARLMEALKAVGGASDIRLVRVYAGEEPLAGAKKVGAHQFVVDLMPKSMKPTFARPEKERRGDRGRGQGGPTTGFSMDAVKEDRAAKRGSGGPRGPGGGPGAARPGSSGPKS